MADTKTSALPTDTAPDRVADYVPTYDASAVATKKVLLSNLGVYVLPSVFWHNLSPADSSTYYLSPWNSLGLLTAATDAKVRIPRTGKVLAVYIEGIMTVPGSAEDSTMFFRLNNTSNTTISSVVKLNASTVSYSNTALGIAVTAGDYYGIGITTPAWVTNPTGVYLTASVYIA